ncbi:DUF7512 family protein [Halorussus salinisoli]|uniref:DUF7512 family protein n=1 Tax=Halorussus salinisoli TaxID=2558242 RepID=UPI00148582D0|nr:hypothetical protein [Halorussus salinisoli]
MIGLETLGPAERAVADVGTVLGEAIALYAGYGAMTTALSGTVRRVLGGGSS